MKIWNQVYLQVMAKKLVNCFQIKKWVSIFVAGANLQSVVSASEGSATDRTFLKQFDAKDDWPRMRGKEEEWTVWTWPLTAWDPSYLNSRTKKSYQSTTPYKWHKLILLRSVKCWHDVLRCVSYCIYVRSNIKILEINAWKCKKSYHNWSRTLNMLFYI